MNMLIDTHLLVWSAFGELSPKAKRYIEDDSNTLYFSPMSIYEIVIKYLKHPSFFGVEPVSFHSLLLEGWYKEQPLTSHHPLMVKNLPLIHNDPFDRILLAQVQHEGMQLLTADKTIALYPGPIIFVG